MDLNNYPLHLTSSELDYELHIRGINNITNNRAKTAALRERMNKEQSGVVSIPKSIEGADFNSEFTRCRALYAGLSSTVEEAVKHKNRPELLRSISRFLHLQSRLERLSPTDSVSVRHVDQLLDLVYNALIELSDPSIGSNVSISHNSSASANSTIQERANRDNSQTDHFSDRVNELNFSNVSDVDGAVGGNVVASPRETMSDQGLLTEEELRDVQNILNEVEQANINPFRKQHIPARVSGISVQSNHLMNDHAFDLRPSSMAPRSTYPTRRTVEFAPQEYNINETMQNTYPTRRTVESTPYEQSKAPSSFDAMYTYPTRRPVDSMQTVYRNLHSPSDRRSVPIYAWKIQFNGEANGMHLYDFLAQVRLYKRSENVSDPDMFYSIIHLLSGRAKLWYMSSYDQFINWEELVTAMKREFLPANYDYLLLNDITNREQKSNESFGEYITHMQALFRCLANPLDEAHKLFIVRKNLLPRYAMSIAPMNLTNLDELTGACRRIDSAASLTKRNTYSMPYSQRESNASATRPHFVSAVSQEQYNNRSTGRNILQCYNCQASGHMHSGCPQPKSGIFCYKCGARGVITSRCRVCSSENGSADRVAPRPPQDRIAVNQGPQINQDTEGHRQF